MIYYGFLFIAFLFLGKVYVSLADGRIVEVLEDGLRTVATIDPERLGLDACRLPQNTVRCGRPLGLKFDSMGTLYTVDPYHGLYSINVETGKVKLVVDVGKLGARFLDDLAILETAGSDHKVFYMSDASTEWDLYDVAYTVAEGDSTGRIISYNSQSGKVKVELAGLPFPNGLELTDDKSALLLCLFNQRAIYRYHLNGSKAGTMAPLATSLPGEPDNIKRSRDQNRETYWVGLYSGRNKHNPHWLADTLKGVSPYLTRFGLRLGRAIGFAIEQTGVLLNNDYLTGIGFDFKTGHLLNVGVCNYGLVVEIDGKSGQVLHSLHSPDGATCALSEAFEVKQTGDVQTGERHFLFGSYANPYLGKLVLPKSAFKQSTVISSSPVSQQQNSSPSSAKSTTTKTASSQKLPTTDKSSSTEKVSKAASSSSSTAKDEL